MPRPRAAWQATGWRGLLPGFRVDLHRHEREENRHQPVVNPHQQRLRDDQPADLDRQRNIEQARVKRPERRICAQQGNHGGDAKGNPAGCFQLHELLQPGLHPALLSALAFESCNPTRAAVVCASDLANSARPSFSGGQTAPAGFRCRPGDTAGPWTTPFGHKGRCAIKFHLAAKRLVLLVRIELTASPLPRECSTTELQQRRAEKARPS